MNISCIEYFNFSSLIYTVLITYDLYKIPNSGHLAIAFLRLAMRCYPGLISMIEIAKEQIHSLPPLVL